MKLRRQSSRGFLVLQAVVEAVVGATSVVMALSANAPWLAWACGIISATHVVLLMAMIVWGREVGASELTSKQ